MVRRRDFPTCHMPSSAESPLCFLSSFLCFSTPLPQRVNRDVLRIPFFQILNKTTEVGGWLVKNCPEI